MSPTGGASGPAVPPSQQEVPEPRKYTGGHIPSRSFQMLQQMTADDQAFRRLGLPFGRDVIRGSSDVTGGSSDVTRRQHRRRAWLLHADLPATAPAPSTPSRVSSRTSSGLRDARNTEEEEPVRTPGHSRLARLLSSFEDDERDSRVPIGAPVKESGRCGSVREAAVSAVDARRSDRSDDTGGGRRVYSAPARDRVTISRENFRFKRNGNACVPNCNRYSESERYLPREASKNKLCQGLCRKDVCHRLLDDCVASPVRPTTANNSGGGRGVRMSSINSIGSVSSVSSGFGDAEETISEPEVDGDEHETESTEELGAGGRELVMEDLDPYENEAGSVNRQEYVREEHCAPASYRGGHTLRELGRGGQDCRDLVRTGDDAKHCGETDGTCDESDTDTDTETDSESGSETDSDSESDSESLSHPREACLGTDGHVEDLEKEAEVGGASASGCELATSSEENDEEESTVTSDDDVTEDDVTLARSRSVTPDVTLLTTERSMNSHKGGVGQSSSNGGDQREDEECLLQSPAEEEEEEIQEEQKREVGEERADEDQRRELEALVADIWRSRREFNAGENDGELLFKDKREEEFDNWLDRLEQRNERLKAMVAPPVADSGTREAFAPVTEEGLVLEKTEKETEEVTEVRAHDEETDDESEESGDESETESGMKEEKKESPDGAANVDERIVDRVVGNVLDLATGALANEDRTSEENRVLRGRKERDKDGIDSQRSIDCNPKFHNTFSSDIPNNNVQQRNAAKARLRISVESKGVQTDDLPAVISNDTVRAAAHSTAPCKRHVPHVIISTPDREVEVDVLLESPDGTSGPYEVWGECYSKVFRPVPPGNRTRAQENTNTRFAAASGASSMVKDSLCNVRDSVSDVKDSVSVVKAFVTKVKASHCYVTGEPRSLSSHASVKAAHSAQSQPETQRRGHVTFQSALRFFRDQTESASGSHRQVAGGSPECSSQRTAPQWMSGSSRPPAVPPWAAKASSSATPAAEAPPVAVGRTAASPAGRQTAAQSRCTASPHVAGSAPVLSRPAEGQPRRSPSHYAHGPESVTAAGHSPPAPPPAPPAPAAVAAGVPTCERIERERQRQEQQRRPPTNGRYAGGRNPSRAFQQLAGEYGDEAGDSREAVLGELRAVGSGQAPRPARPSAVPSRSFRRLQQEYGSQEPEPEPEPVRSGPQQTAVIRTTPEQQKQRMAAVSKTYRLLQTDPTAVPSVLGRNGR